MGTVEINRIRPWEQPGKVYFRQALGTTALSKHGADLYPTPLHLADPDKGTVGGGRNHGGPDPARTGGAGDMAGDVAGDTAGAGVAPSLGERGLCAPAPV